MNQIIHRSLLAELQPFLAKQTSILVSACLLGIQCRYDGKEQLQPDILQLKDAFHLIPICPEQLGGLPTPRKPVEIVWGSGEDVLAGRSQVCNPEGEDVTDAFIRGALEVEKIARRLGPQAALLKQRSPSCGYGQIYQHHQIIVGNGVTAALLKQAGLLIMAID